MNIRWIKWIVLAILLLFVLTGCEFANATAFPFETFTKDNWTMEFRLASSTDSIPDFQHPNKQGMNPNVVKVTYKEPKTLVSQDYQGFFAVKSSPALVIFMFSPGSGLCISADDPLGKRPNEGIYSWTYDGTILSFVPYGDTPEIADPCKERREVLKGEWTKVE